MSEWVGGSATGAATESRTGAAMESVWKVFGKCLESVSPGLRPIFYFLSSSSSSVSFETH